MSVTLENANLLARIHARGAELYSLYNKSVGLEYMWSGDPAFWGKTSPVLFPIVGALRNNTYFYGTGEYSLSRHGFARDAVFEIEKDTGREATFVLRSSPETLSRYPFPFELRLKYFLNADRLTVAYEVTNTGPDPMHFSIGGHPAFRVPLAGHSSYNKYFLKFPEDSALVRWRLASDGLIGNNSVRLELIDHKLRLSHSLFYEDALVVKTLRSSVITLGAEGVERGIDFSREDFPYLGIWAAKDADFVCIEPWCGIADSVDHDQQLVSKEGIEHVLAGRTWSRRWSVRPY